MFVPSKLVSNSLSKKWEENHEIRFHHEKYMGFEFLAADVQSP